PFRRSLIGRRQPSLPLGLLRGARIGGGHLHARRSGKLLHRIHEGQALVLGQEPDRIAMRRTAEAMVETLVIIDVKAGRLLIMKRAAALELTASLGEFHRST